MSVTTIRLNEQEEAFFQSYAELTGQPLSTLMKQALTEKIEEEYDLQAVKEYESAKANGEVILVDHEEFWGDL